MGFLSGKRILIAGVASNRSIAWGCAQAMHREGAELAFTYPNEKMKPRVENLAAELGSEIVLPCDVASDQEIADLFSRLGDTWDGLDAMIHSIVPDAIGADATSGIQSASTRQMRRVCSNPKANWPTLPNCRRMDTP